MSEPNTDLSIDEEIVCTSTDNIETTTAEMTSQEELLDSFDVVADPSYVTFQNAIASINALRNNFADNIIVGTSKNDASSKPELSATEFRKNRIAQMTFLLQKIIADIRLMVANIYSETKQLTPIKVGLPDQPSAASRMQESHGIYILIYMRMITGAVTGFADVFRAKELEKIISVLRIQYEIVIDLGYKSLISDYEILFPGLSKYNYRGVNDNKWMTKEEIDAFHINYLIRQAKLAERAAKPKPKYTVDSIVGARDRNGHWWLSYVREVVTVGNKIAYYVEYMGWGKEFNELIIDLYRIKPYNPRRHKLYRPSSRTENGVVVVPHGVDDADSDSDDGTTSDDDADAEDVDKKITMTVNVPDEKTIASKKETTVEDNVTD